jgi:Protein of unknown function (DUF1579)
MTMPRFLVHHCVAASLIIGAVSFASAQEGVPKPTAEHKILAADEGTWDAAIKSYINGPDSEPAVSKGVEVNTVLTGGLWISSSFSGDFGGMAFEGRGQFGYDPNKKKYVGTWIDSMSPALTVLEGTYDAKTKTITYTGDGVCPIDGSKQSQRMVTTSNSDGTREFTLYVTGTQTGGKEAKMMVINYTKRK